MKFTKQVSNKSELPEGQNYDGIAYAVGAPAFYAIYKYHWDKRKLKGVWNFVMHQEVRYICECCGK